MKTRTYLAVAAFAASCFCGVQATDYYVDAVSGNDANDGLAAGEGNAMESFAALFAKYTITSGDKVHAAAGVYTNGVMTSGSAKYRVIVPAGVTLVGDEGADRTVILGEAHNGGTNGCGDDALRCAYVGDGAQLRGFTLTGGHVPAWGSSAFGGAAGGAGAGKSFVIDCIVTNNVSGRGAVASATAVRCRFGKNVGNTSTPDMIFGAAYGCVFGDCPSNQSNGYQTGPFVNCTFFGTGVSVAGADASHLVTLRNCAVKKYLGNYLSVYRSYFTSAASYSTITTNDSSRLVSANDMKLDADGRPQADSPVINQGVNGYYDGLPASVADKFVDLVGRCRILENVIDVGAYEVGQMHYYVDAEHGNDGWDGSTSVIPADPTSTVGPKQTLERAFADCNLENGDIVHAAAGVYASGSTNGYRVVVPAGMTLVGDEGADRTVILGKAHDGGTNGCGDDALRCAYIGDGAQLRGFTLTGGHVPAWGSSAFGGAAYGVSVGKSFVVDCIITNNVSGRGAIANATAARCRFGKNVGHTSTPDMIFSAAYGCVFGDCPSNQSNGYQTGPFVNCTFFGTGVSVAGADAQHPVTLRNCAVKKYLGNYLSVYRSFFTSAANYGTITTNDSSRLVSADDLKLDADGRPQADSPIIDQGFNDYYDGLPASVPDTFVDLVGIQRVYNGLIDIGAYEYDWRGDFTTRLGRRGATVVTADAGVVTNGTSAVSIPVGGSLSIRWTLPRTGRYRFSILPEESGTPSIVLNDEPLAIAADGQYSFFGEVGSTRTITISCLDEGHLVASAFTLDAGFRVIVR